MSIARYDSLPSHYVEDTGMGWFFVSYSLPVPFWSLFVYGQRSPYHCESSL